jgi:3-deoxy-D-manno-octulosonate 8-phosphate phosphatase (KDO 8-P phosphatase)
MKDILDKAAQIRLVIFDVDGVLTDGSIYIGDQGEEYKAFYARDGLGMKMLQSTGVELAVITGRTSRVVEHRMASLCIVHVFQGQHDKLAAFEQLCQNLSLDPDQIAFIGDDLIDLPVMRRVGLAVAVNDAHPLVVHHAHWHTPNGGGRGAARDVCELIMQAQGTWMQHIKYYER